MTDAVQRASAAASYTGSGAISIIRAAGRYGDRFSMTQSRYVTSAVTVDSQLRGLPRVHEQARLTAGTAVINGQLG